MAQRDRQNRTYDLFLLSSFLGFWIGIGLFAALHLAVRVIEGSPFLYAGPLDTAFEALLFGVAWMMISLVALPSMWAALKPRVPLWPSLGRVALVAFLVQAIVIVIFDLIITSYNLKPWINAHINDDLWGAVELALGVIPALLAAYLTMRRAAVA